MANSDELYNGILDEFIDWLTGLDTDTKAPRTEGKAVSGAAIRKLLMDHLQRPIYNYNDPKKTSLYVFSSQAAWQRWNDAGGDDQPDNPYKNNILIELPKPSAYKCIANFLLNGENVEGSDTKYIVQQGDSVDAVIKSSLRTVLAEDNVTPYSEGYSQKFTIINGKGVQRSFTVKRQNETAIGTFYPETDNIGNYLTSGQNTIVISVVGEGIADTPKSGVKGNVITFTIYIVSLSLNVKFNTNAAATGYFHLNKPVSVGSGANPQLNISYELVKTISSNNNLNFAMYIDADLPTNKSAFALGRSGSGDYDYNLNDGQADYHITGEDIGQPSFIFSATDNQTMLSLLSNHSQGGEADATTFFSNLENTLFAGQHSVQLYAFIELDEKVFRSNTVYFTFNTNTLETQNLYINICYNGNTYENPYYVDTVKRRLLGKQYNEMNIQWSLYSKTSATYTIAWELTYNGGKDNYNLSLTSQTVDAQRNIYTISFIPLYYVPEGAVLRAYNVINDLGTIYKQEVFSIPIYITPASTIIKEADGYSMKLSAYSKANKTQDQREWIPTSSTGTIAKVSVHSDTDAYTEFHNINFDSDADGGTGWLNHGLNIFGKNTYAIINFNALEIGDSGHTIEIEFETMRVLNDNDILIRIGTYTGGNIIITPTKAYVGKGSTATSALTNYKINERMRLAFIFNPPNTTDGFDPNHPDYNLIHIVNNGILERSALMDGGIDSYASTTGFIQIGHKEGDIDINNNEGKGSGIIVYNIKVYPKALTYAEALQNYILDATDKSTIISRNRAYNMDNNVLEYDKCLGYIPTFLIYGDLTKILNKNENGVLYLKEDSETDVTLTYTNPFDSTRNFVAEGCMIRKHGQSTLTYPITSMKFWLNKSLSGSPVKFTWEGSASYNLTKNRYVMKQLSFVDDSNHFPALNGYPSIPANKFVLQANYADSSGVHNGAIERLIQLTWMGAQVDGVYVLRTPPQLFTTEKLNNHDYMKKVVLTWKTIETEDPLTGDIIESYEPETWRLENIEQYTLEQAYSNIFTDANLPANKDQVAWRNAWANIKEMKMHELINMDWDYYNALSEEQQDIIDAELSYRGYGKIHSKSLLNVQIGDNSYTYNTLYMNKNGDGRGHVAGHIQWSNIFPTISNIPRPFPYQIGVAADSLPCVVFYQTSTNMEAGKQFLGQYVLMDDKKSEQISGANSIYTGKAGQDYTDPFCYTEAASKENNGGKKQNAKEYRIWNNKNVLRIEVLNINTLFTSFLSSTTKQKALKGEEKQCQFDDVVITKDENNNDVIMFNWEIDFELIFPDPDDVGVDSKDQQEENEERAELGLPLIEHYYDNGSLFRKTVLPWVNFHKWAVSTVGSQNTFEEQAPRHLDLWKMAAYYIFFLRFGLVDSVERNAQWKTYDGLHWHCEPWDMDIALGNNNQGQITYDPPMTRQTLYGADYAFSGSSATYNSYRGNWIWNALEAWDTWSNDILPKVAAALYNAGLNYDNINYMFDQEYVYKWSESIYNVSGHFKYVEVGDYGKLGWLQGSRETHRHWWLYESMNYYDSLWKCGEYVNKRVEVFTDKAANTPGYVVLTTSRSVNVAYYQNQIPIGAYNTTAGVSTGQNINLSSLSLSTKVPFILYGSSFFEKLDISTISQGCKRLNLTGCVSAITGGTLYELNVGIPGTSGNTPIYTNYGVNKPNLEGNATIFEHITTYNIAGQTGFDWSTSKLSSMKNLEKLNAKASGLESVDFKNLYFISLELPATTYARINEQTEKISTLESVTLTNVLWDSMSFWNATRNSNTSIKAIKVSKSIETDNDTITTQIPYTIRSIKFAGSTSTSPKSKKFICDWLWSIYDYVRSSNLSSTNIMADYADYVTNITTAYKIVLNNVDWSEDTGLVTSIEEGHEDDVKLISYKELELLHYIPGASQTANTPSDIDGYIVIGDSGNTPNRLSDVQMANLQTWYGEDIFTNNARLQISHVYSYISLSITISNVNSGYRQGNNIYLKETESHDIITVNATRFGVRNDNTIYDWKFGYYATEGTDENMQYTGSNVTQISGKSIIISYPKNNRRKNTIDIYAKESKLNSYIVDGTIDEHITSYPIVIIATDRDANISQLTNINIVPKIWPTDIMVTTMEQGDDSISMYEKMNMLGIRSNDAIATIDTKLYFEEKEQWHSILAERQGEGYKTLALNGVSRVKYTVDGIQTSYTGGVRTQGAISFRYLVYTIIYYAPGSNLGTIITLDNATIQNANTAEYTPVIDITDNIKVDYLFDTDGRLKLKFDNLQSTPLDLSLRAQLYFGQNDPITGDIVVNNKKINEISLKMRTLLDDSPLLDTNDTTNAGTLIKTKLSNYITLPQTGYLYKMDLLLLDDSLNQGSQTLGKLEYTTTSLQRNFSNPLTSLGDSVFKYMPNISELSLYGNKNMLSFTEYNFTLVQSFDFSYCTKLKKLDMRNMEKLTNVLRDGIYANIIDLSNCTQLLQVLSDKTNITFKYPATNTLTTISIGNPLAIIITNNTKLATITGPSGKDVEHIDMEYISNSNTFKTFTYFGAIYDLIKL